MGIFKAFFIYIKKKKKKTFTEENWSKPKRKEKINSQLPRNWILKKEKK
jgi:hypothetical protein